MTPAKVSDHHYIQWLIASPRTASCTEAAACSLVAHDAYTRLLERLEPNSQQLWDEVEPLIERSRGFLVIDDTTLDKPYARRMDLVVQHWSGKHRRVVDGINLITLLWTDGDVAIPVDWRVFNKAHDGLTKNDHARQMLDTARQRGFQPQCVLWDGWYSSMENLKLLRNWGWKFFVGLNGNRHVDPDGQGNREIRTLSWSGVSQTLHLKGFGWVEAYSVIDPAGERRFFVSSERGFDEAQVQQHREIAYQVEGYHRGLKQECHIERCQARKARRQLNHIALVIRAFVRLELRSYKTGFSRLALKRGIVRDAVRAYLKRPFIQLPAPAA